MTSLRFVGQWHPSLILVCAIGLGCLAWWLYWRGLSRLTVGSAAWFLPSLRALAIFLIVVTLAEPVVETRRREGNPGRVLFLLDDSRSMSVVDPEKHGQSRFERAADQLLGATDGVLPQLSTNFELTVARFGSQGGGAEGSSLPPGRAVRMWERNVTVDQQLPDSAAAWLPDNWGARSPVGDALADAAPDGQGAAAETNSVIVLLTDGQSNSGASPLAVADDLQAGHTPIFAVGYGSTTEPPDVALTAIDAPRRVYRTDLLSGTLVIADRLPAGTRFTAEILHDGEVVWQSEHMAETNQRRELPFNFAVAPLFDAELKRLSRDVTYAALPLKLEARVTPQFTETNSDNNAQALHVDVASQKSRVLLIDGRSRWETRYLRNLFQRDPAWDIETVMESALHAEDDPGSGLAQLPATRDELLKYNLVILGDAHPRLWRPQQLNWLKDFVERGGGLVLIDGARGHLRDIGYSSIDALLPVRWTGSETAGAGKESAKPVELTAAGKSLAAFELTSNEEQDNAEQWNRLPPLQFVSEVEPLPGSEVLVKAVAERGARPLIVTRRFGAGRVLFVGTDETWRWRYKIADVVHQRVWNQLARWVMRVPLSVQGEFVSLDTGATSVPLGQAVEVRCQLRELDGSPTVDKAVTAIVRRDGQIVTRLPLNASPEVPGFYTGEFGALAAGDYQVQVEAPGYSRQALDVQSQFSVVAAESREMLHVAQDEQLLRQLAAKTGGAYVAEEDIGQLVELLEPWSTGRIVQSATLIWQSYWWFSAAMLLLIGEWILRKRSGLI